MKDVPELADVACGDCFVRDGHLFIKMVTETLQGLEVLQEIGVAIKRPVASFGSTYNGHAYLWIEIPLTNVSKSHYFGNMPPERKKK